MPRLWTRCLQFLVPLVAAGLTHAVSFFALLLVPSGLCILKHAVSHTASSLFLSRIPILPQAGNLSLIASPLTKVFFYRYSIIPANYACSLTERLSCEHERQP